MTAAVTIRVRWSWSNLVGLDARGVGAQLGLPLEVEDVPVPVGGALLGLVAHRLAFRRERCGRSLGQKDENEAERVIAGRGPPRPAQGANCNETSLPSWRA